MKKRIKARPLPVTHQYFKAITEDGSCTILLKVVLGTTTARCYKTWIPDPFSPVEALQEIFASTPARVLAEVQQYKPQPLTPAQYKVLLRVKKGDPPKD